MKDNNFSPYNWCQNLTIVQNDVTWKMIDNAQNNGLVTVTDS
jgi:hypothetical protein